MTLTTTIPTTIQKETKTMNEPDARAHRDAVLAYLELSMFAASGYPALLTDDQKAAYLTLPYLMDECKAAWYRLPEVSRPPHYLLSC